MDQKKKLEELHKESLEKFDEYLKARGEIGQEHHEKLHEAKKNWQVAWSKLMEALMVLENLEI
ncbi:MAG TPA: hypothetical protein VKC90_13650 [Chitinophagaceae bacterium]|nr:hypothetical protein [Chitinophagaceae bacterium]